MINITWDQFAAKNHNQTKSFEDLCRQVFTLEYLKGLVTPHTDHNLPGVEVLPVLEPENEDGKPRKRISFQAKYITTSQNAYSKFKESAKKTVQYHAGKLDKVYLFCNKTLTTTTKGYQSIVQIHKLGGIETVPVSNDDLLDIIRKYGDLADTYFLLQRDTNKGITYNTLVYVNCVPEKTDTNSNSASLDHINVELLQELVNEKINRCRNHAASLEIEAFKDELKTVLSFELDGIEAADALYYYQFLVFLQEGKDAFPALAKCTQENRIEASRLIGYFSNPKELSADGFKTLSPIAQIFILGKLFSSNLWKKIVDLHTNVAEESCSSIGISFDMYYGLSLLNLQRNEEAKDVFHMLYEQTKEQRMQFYEVCAEIKIENNVYQSSRAGHHDLLIRLLERLDSFKTLKQYSKQELYIAVLTMESLYHLSIADKAFIDTAIEKYKAFSQNTQNNPIIRFYYALCYEMKGEKDSALKIYSELDWRTDPYICERYMLCLVMNDDAEKAIAAFSEIPEKTIRIEAVYLLALERSGVTWFKNELKKSIDAHCNSLSEILQIAFYTDTEKPTSTIVVKALKKAYSEDSYEQLPSHEKIEMILFLAHSKEIVFLDKALTHIDDVSSINHFTINEIYRSLYNILKTKISNKASKFVIQKDVDAADRIADRFMHANIFRKNFLQIKILCAEINHSPISSLLYSRELFIISPDDSLAYNIIIMLYNRNENNYSEYEPYLTALKKSNKPECCLLIARVMGTLGRDPEAEYYAYKALYLLNNSDDYNVYWSYYVFYLTNRMRFQDEGQIHTVKGGTVVILEECSTTGIKSNMKVCLDPEMELTDLENHSMGIRHVGPSDPDYTRLHGCGLGQVIKLHDRSYKIIQILNRVYYGFGYVNVKIQEHPEMLNGIAWMIPTGKIEDAIDKIRKLTDRSEQTDALFNAYHFKNNDLGLPIDALTFGDYSRYVATFKYLLFCKDEALYAGLPFSENKEIHLFVPSLSTLVLLAVMKRMDILMSISDRIIVPESYLSFIQREYSNAIARCQSAGMLSFVDKQPIIQDPDKSIPDIWNDIMELCETCEAKRIAEQEKIEFQIFDKKYKGERFFTEMKLNEINLDALILADREKAAFLCDDLFFRKLAMGKQILNLNSVALMQYGFDLDMKISFIKDLSKTNYIYIPLYARSDKELDEIVSNLMDGEKKKAYYTPYIQNFINIREQVFRRLMESIFDGDEIELPDNNNEKEDEH